MKVLYVTQYFSSKPDHASTVTTYEIVKGLAQRGHEVGVVSAHSPGIARIYGGRMDSPRVIHAFPVPQFSPRWYDGFSTFLTHTLLHVPLVGNVMFVDRFYEDFDAVISMYHPTHLATVSAYLLSRILKLPLVVKIHDFIIEAAVPQTLRRMYNVVLGSANMRVLKRSSAVLVQSRELMQVVKKVARVDEKKLIDFPNGVDTNLFRPHVKSEPLQKELGLEGKTVLLFLGALHRGRHPELLIKALPDIVREIRHLKVLFVGEGPQKSELMSLAARLGVSNSVGFVGTVAHSQVPEIISLADINMGPFSVDYNPANFGCIPLTILESMACEKPVIVSRGFVSESLVIDDYNGVLFEPGDVDGLSSAVISLTEDQRFSRVIGRNARRHVEKAFSWDVLITRLESLLNSLVN